MSIKLYYIENISRLDTLYFDNITSQNTFFNNRVVETVDSKFPPHFSNSIRFEVTDLDLTTQVNYLSLYFDNKYYYYFIDAINYDNEGVYNLVLTMDTIQTYMFNISFKSALVNRMSIPRWVKDNASYIINRDYIRENLSQGDFVNTSYTELSYAYNPFYCITSRQPLGIGIQGAGSQQLTILKYKIDSIQTYNLNNGLYYYLIPIFTTRDYEDFQYEITSGGNTEVFSANYTEIMKYISQDPNVINIKYITLPQEYLSIFGYTRGVDEVQQSNYVSFEILDTTYTNYLSLVQYQVKDEDRIIFGSPIINLGALTIEDKSTLRYLNILDNFERSKSINNVFDVKYIPQLIDENYININFGERLGYTGYPLHLLNKPYVYLSEFYDIIDGNRVFKVTDNNDKIDNHLTTIINTTDEVIDIYNDQWQNYISTNRGTLTTGIKLAKQNNLYNVLMGSFKNVANTAIDTASMPQTKNQKRNQGGRIAQGVVTEIGLVGDYLMENYNIDKRLQVTRENFEYAPDTEKQGNTISADIKAKSLQVIYRVNVIEDYLQVAQKLEYFGYKVSKYYNNKSLFEELNIRTYYNVIQCSDITIDLIGTVNTQFIIQNIKERFINGLRLWNNNIDFTKFDLDNVEKEVVENE